MCSISKLSAFGISKTDTKDYDTTKTSDIKVVSKFDIGSMGNDLKTQKFYTFPPALSLQTSRVNTSRQTNLSSYKDKEQKGVRLEYELNFANTKSYIKTIRLCFYTSFSKTQLFDYILKNIIDVSVEVGGQRMYIISGKGLVLSQHHSQSTTNAQFQYIELPWLSTIPTENIYFHSTNLFINVIDKADNLKISLEVDHQQSTRITEMNKTYYLRLQCQEITSAVKNNNTIEVDIPFNHLMTEILVSLDVCNKTAKQRRTEAPQQILKSASLVLSSCDKSIEQTFETTCLKVDTAHQNRQCSIVGTTARFQFIKDDFQYDPLKIVNSCVNFSRVHQAKLLLTFSDSNFNFDVYVLGINVNIGISMNGLFGLKYSN